MRASVLWITCGILILLGPYAMTGEIEGNARAIGDAAVTGLEPFPASFEGELPCADCDGIRYRLNLFSDHAFFLGMEYLGRDTEMFDIGTWALSSDRRTLVLKGGREAPLMFKFDSADALTKLDLEGGQIQSDLNYTLKRTASFERIEPRLLMRGMYSYMADAALFQECLTGQRWPVVQEADNRTLEEAYLRVRKSPGAPVLVSLEGRVAQKPAMEGTGTEPSLVPERFVGIWPGETCGARFVTEALENTYWKLTRLGDEAVTFAEVQKEPHMILRADGDRVGGSGGCNRLMGAYALDGDSLTFSQFGMTRMACPHGMELERRFVQALETVRSWQVVGQHLELFDEGGNRVARFEARHMN